MSLNEFVERYSYKKAAFICDVTYMKMWLMVENNMPIKIIQNNGTYNAWKGGKLLNTVTESELKQRGIE